MTRATRDNTIPRDSAGICRIAFGVPPLYRFRCPPEAAAYPQPPLSPPSCWHLAPQQQPADESCVLVAEASSSPPSPLICPCMQPPPAEPAEAVLSQPQPVPGL